MVSEPRMVQLPSSPPPPNVALSEPLPGGVQGWLRAESDMRTFGPAARRGARRWSSHPSQRRKRSPGNAAIGRVDRDRTMVQAKTKKRSRMAVWSEMAQQMVTTIFNADGGRLEH